MHRTRYNFAGCLPYDQAAAGFYLPLFTSKDRNGIFVQVVDSEGAHIKDFILLDDNLAGYIEMKNDVAATLGDAPLFVFRGSSNFFVGRLSDLKERVKGEISPSSHASLQLQCAELFGDAEEKRDARAKAMSNLRNRLVHDQEHAYFRTSLFLSSLRNHVVMGLKPDAPREHLESLLRLVLTHSDVRDPTFISDDVWSKLQPLMSLDREELRERVLSELPNEEVDFQRVSPDAAQAELGEQEKALALRKLQGLRRQEMRLALILDEYIRRPEVAEFLLNAHRDRGGMARDAMKLIRNYMGHERSQSDRELLVARLIGRLFTMSFSLSRGETLYYLAHKLGQYERVADAIRRKANQSRARNVWHLREAIEGALQDARQQAESTGV